MGSGDRLTPTFIIEPKNPTEIADAVSVGFVSFTVVCIV
jgi:hypothetical protein